MLINRHKSTLVISAPTDKSEKIKKYLLNKFGFTSSPKLSEESSSLTVTSSPSN